MPVTRSPRRISIQLVGQLYAARVSIANSFQLEFRKVVAPGFTGAAGESASPVVRYHTQVVYLGELGEEK